MSTVEPDPNFTDAEKRLIMLLSRLFQETISTSNSNRNYPPDRTLISDGEAKEIINDVENFANSRKFLEEAYFCESVLKGDYNERAREIFLSGRTRNGKTRTMAAKQWDEFQRRLGSSGSPYYRRPIQPMSFSVFQKMERKLLIKAGISEPIVNLIMQEIGQQESDIERIRAKQKMLQYGVIKHAIDGVLRSLKARVPMMDVQSLSNGQVVGAITLIADSSVMFTTRDWSVAGTISTMAGALVAASQAGDK